VALALLYGFFEIDDDELLRLSTLDLGDSSSPQRRPGNEDDAAFPESSLRAVERF